MTVSDYNQFYSEGRMFLEESLKSQPIILSVVITHHPPTFFNYPEKYANSSINEAFGTEMFNFIEENKIDYWIYGHHHCNVPDFNIGKTKLVTNQLGYIKYVENENFKNDAFF
ncbi:metallophosphoesterase [Flavobacterium gilvum]|uniref:metallophosphoesterase n=1 Tax=Flavobacterium gilvum TaxID=1492737 RepID=UPI0004E4361F|nr:metallophosphoesterase [Flavobacterium gilvum]KFC59179.1 metallophosphoesterase [Flavobacterium gilvum]